MTQFSSGKHEKLTADPHPNVWEGHSEHNQMRADTDVYRKGAPWNFEHYRRRPRPEFDRPLTNPANPVLAEFRRDAGESVGLDAGGFIESLSTLATYWRDEELLGEGYATPEQIAHARAVLTRLAALA